MKRCNAEHQDADNNGRCDICNSVTTAISNPPKATDNKKGAGWVWPVVVVALAAAVITIIVIGKRRLWFK